MTMKPTQDLHVRGTELLDPPEVIKNEFPMTEKANETVVQGRQMVRDVLDKKDKRLLVVTGPCSIHDKKAALEYAEKLSSLKPELEDQLAIVMRVYFEKPRTTMGWKGLINDPHLDGTMDIAYGLRRAREILLAVNELGLPAGTELLDPITPQYMADLISWSAVGARTTESQTHREMSSGLSMPVGFKNNTDGSTQVAVDAMEAARHPHHFLGMDNEGRVSVIKTAGNAYGHVVLRGGHTRSNYDPESIREATEMCAKYGLDPTILVDCSHANSGKKHEKQEVVWNNVIEQRVAGNTSLIGVLLESNLLEGNQKLADPQDLQYGVSITDACVNFETTERLLRNAHAMMQKQVG